MKQTLIAKTKLNTTPDLFWSVAPGSSDSDASTKEDKAARQLRYTELRWVPDTIPSLSYEVLTYKFAHLTPQTKTYTIKVYGHAITSLLKASHKIYCEETYNQSNETFQRCHSSWR